MAISHAGPDQHGVRHNIAFPIDVNGSNVPMLHGVSCTTLERVTIGPHLRSCHARHLLNLNLKDSVVSAWYPQFDDPCRGDSGYAVQFIPDASSFGLSNVTAAENANLTAAQKELLLKSWILGISMKRIQELMRHVTCEDIKGAKILMPPVLDHKFNSTPTCPIPRSETWELSRGTVRTPKAVKQQALEERAGVISGYQYEPGDFVSTDQFVVPTLG